jgi:ribonuclease R
MNSAILSEKVLILVSSAEYRPMKPRMMLKALKLADEEYRELRRAVKQLVRDGRVLYGANHLVLPTVGNGSVRPKNPKPGLPKPGLPKPGLSVSPMQLQNGDSGMIDFGAGQSPIADQRLAADQTSGEEKPATGSTLGVNQIVGVFRSAPSMGYGFVEVPRGGTTVSSETPAAIPSEALGGSQSQISQDSAQGANLARAEISVKMPDIFIPEFRKLNALDGDTVRVQLRRPMLSGSRGTGRGGKEMPRHASGRLEGEIVEVVARKRREFTGTYQTDGQKSFVWLDGAKLERPVSLGDVRGMPLENNDKVVVELVRFPDELQAGEAVLLKVLGSLRNPAVDTMAVMIQFALPEEFPESVIEDARAQADRFSEEVIPEGRKDLTAVPTLTIDPVDARDFDDAISLSKNERGNWELQVHIADVAFFVPVGGILDQEARQRGNSVYLPDRVIPMLPETISNHLASLQPDRRRLAKTVFMEYSSEGVLLHAEVYNSVIRNAYRFNYEQIDQYLLDPEPWKERLDPAIFQLVQDMHTLAMQLREIRRKGGAVELTLPEVKVDLDRLGKVKGAHVVHHTQSHQMIEEFMLAANQAVASWLDQLKLPFLRRAHAPPDQLKIRRLNQFIRALGIPADEMQDRFEIQRVIDSVKGKATSFSVNYAILKSMSKAVYQCEFERHYALNMTHYCHFTSPIRRYPDLVVHRIVDKLVKGEQARENTEVLEQMGEHCSHTEQNAEQAERELVRVKLLHFLEKRVGELLTGIVWGVKANGLVVRGVEIPVDGMIPLDRLPSDRYRYDRDTHTLEGQRSGNQFRLGDELIVRVERVDLARRHLDFRFEKLVHHERRGPGRPGGGDIGSQEGPGSRGRSKGPKKVFGKGSSKDKGQGKSSGGPKRKKR